MPYNGGEGMNTITSTFQEDAQHVIGPDNHRWYKYVVPYRDKRGREFNFDIYALSDKDALERLDRIQQGNLEAFQCYATIPVTPLNKVWVPLLVWWKNLFKS
jgi:hypothetical protein